MCVITLGLHVKNNRVPMTPVGTRAANQVNKGRGHQNIEELRPDPKLVEGIEVASCLLQRTSVVTRGGKSQTTISNVQCGRALDNALHAACQDMYVAM